MNGWRRFALVAAVSAIGLFPPGGRAAVVPVSPADGEVFLLDCGVTEEEIAAFRSIMLEP